MNILKEEDEFESEEEILEEGQDTKVAKSVAESLESHDKKEEDESEKKESEEEGDDYEKESFEEDPGDTKKKTEERSSVIKESFSLNKSEGDSKVQTMKELPTTQKINAIFSSERNSMVEKRDVKEDSMFYARSSQGTNRSSDEKKEIPLPQTDTDRDENEQEQENEEEEQDELEEEDEDDELNDIEKLQELASQALEVLALCFKRSKTTVRAFFGQEIFTGTIKDVKLELINLSAFLEGIRQLGVDSDSLTEMQYKSLIRVLVTQENTEAVIVQRLIDIMDTFGITEGMYNKKKKSKLTFDELDDKSLRILMKLYCYLMENEMTVYDFFKGVIYNQQVKSKSTTKEFELIASKDFFKKMFHSGLKKKPDEHNNLMKFLCLDKKFIDIFMVGKINKALEEFNSNEDLTKAAEEVQLNP